MIGKVTFLFQSIPRVWRWISCLFVLLTASIAVIVISWRATHTGYACLRIEGWNQIGLLDVDSGSYFPLASATRPPQPFPGANDILSSDRMRSVHFVGSNTFATSSGKLVVQRYKTSLPLSQRPLSSASIPWQVQDAVWSPNGLWIAYYWRIDGEHEVLALADADGQPQQTTVINQAPGEAIQLDGWSPDSSYFALVNHQLNATSISFWSVPDLHPVEPGLSRPLSPSALIGCVPQGAVSTDVPSCVHWSNQGHQASYISIDSNNEPQLVITRLDKSVDRSFALPDAALEILSWSPDGRYVAVSSQAVSSPSMENLSFFGLEGTQFPNILAVPTGASCTTCSLKMVWSPDGKSILYAVNRQDLPKVDLALPGKASVSIYSFSTGTDRHIFNSPQSSNIAMYPSPDNLVVAMDTDDALYLVSLKDGWTRKLPISAVNGGLIPAWSPDATLLAAASKLTQGSAIDIFDAGGSEIHHYELTDSTNEMTWTSCRLS